MSKFKADFLYQNRDERAKYIWEKYRPAIDGKSILDVGSGENFLKKYISEDTKYFSIDIGGEPDQVVNLEREKIPFEDNAFDVLICTDVLEHLENIHDAFDDLCRVAKEYVIISLPCPWADYFHMLHKGDYAPGVHIKYYGLPKDKPSDRHKWFFAFDDAVNFVSHRAELNHAEIVQFDYFGNRPRPHRRWKRILYQLLNVPPPYHPELDERSFYVRTLWWILKTSQD